MQLHKKLQFLSPNQGLTNVTIGKSLQVDDILFQKNLFVIADEKLEKKLLKKFVKARFQFLPSGEDTKSRKVKEKVEDTLVKQGCTKDSHIIAIGGGSILDLVGYVAAGYMRGVLYSSIPTTLLAMCDAAHGGKCGINAHGIKNLFGSIYYPRSILIDVDFLQTLPPFELQNGAVEILKMALLTGHAKVDSFRKNLPLLLKKEERSLIDTIYESVQMKMQVVEKSYSCEEHRHLLNLGHTIGHALEVLEEGRISHGQAVAMGILVECQMAHELKLLSLQRKNEIFSLIESIGLPLKIQKKCSLDMWKRLFSYDKKSFSQKPRFVLLEDIGKPYVKDGAFCHEVPEEILINSLGRFL